MKTTFDLPDDLVIEAKKLAAELRCPLRDLVQAGLRAELYRRRAPRSAGSDREIRWVTVDGGLPPGLDVSDRASMYEGILGRQ